MAQRLTNTHMHIYLKGAMIMKRKHWFFTVPVVILLSAAILFTSCAKSADEAQLYDANPVASTMAAAMYDGYAEEDAAMTYSTSMRQVAGDYLSAKEEQAAGVDYENNEVAAKAAGEDGAAEPVSAAGRKLIKDLYAHIETREFDKYIAAIEAKTAALGGHVSGKDISDGGYYAYQATRNANLVLRVPADDLKEFQKALGENGKVINTNESERDVTMQYTDVDAHIKVLRTEREALMKLLEQANSTEELLLVREQLTRVRYELDALEGQMRVMEDQIALSTVTLYVQEVERVTQDRPKGFWAGAWDMFKDSVDNIIWGLRDFSQGFLGAIPYLVLLLIPVVILIVLLRRRIKKRRAAKAAQAAQE